MHDRQEILAADVCGCYYCLSTFAPSTIEEWTDFDHNGVGRTALCPQCGVDAVIPSHPSRRITPELRRLHDDGFGGP
jgi:hypothetical protein